jgi:hypothetical protein
MKPLTERQRPDKAELENSTDSVDSARMIILQRRRPPGQPCEAVRFRRYRFEAVKRVSGSPLRRR